MQDSCPTKPVATLGIASLPPLVRKKVVGNYTFIQEEQNPYIILDIDQDQSPSLSKLKGEKKKAKTKIQLISSIFALSDSLLSSQKLLDDSEGVLNML